MIKSIEITNFKSIKSSGKIEIAPITIVMGPNSGGKSSLLKPFLLMKQTAESRDIQRSVLVDGAYVKLGPYREYVHNHKLDKEVRFSVTFHPDNAFVWRSRKKRDLKEDRSIAYMAREEIIPDSIELEVSFMAGANEQTINKQTRYLIKDEKLGVIQISKTRGSRGTFSGSIEYGNDLYRYTPNKRSKFYDMFQSARGSLGLGKVNQQITYNSYMLSSYVTRAFEIAFSKIYYLGPLRQEPAPLYGASSQRPQDVGKSGEDATTVLWVGRSEKKQKELKKKVEKWMERFQIASALRLHKIGPFFQVYLTDWFTGIKSNLTDVGFGASQLLPVIVAGFYAPIDSLLIAEQPEIHLHPKAQTQLGDLLIAVSKEKKSLLIETHSEHLLMRIQRRIADGTISPNSVAIYYCDPSSEGTNIKRIKIDEFGQLQSDLPAGFFDESFLETKAHIEEIVKRKQEIKIKELA